MTMSRAAAWLYTAVSAGVVFFQLALAAGVPWGTYAMGGAFPGRFPPAMRVAALVQAMLIAGIAVVVLSRAGLAFTGWSRASRRLVWIAVAFSALSLVLNLITPSPSERAIWAPVALLMLASSVAVAVSNATAGSP
jgi:thiamine transporter ThiT